MRGRSLTPSVRVLLVGLLLLGSVSVSAPARASSALELVRIARSHEEAHQDELALRRYMDALGLDPTCEQAYLGLGSLRARRGDLHEAERVYSMALEHLPQLRTARLARAYVRRALGAHQEAADDLLTGAEEDIGALRILAGWYGEDGQRPAQLATWRRIAARADGLRDSTLQNEARTMIRALVILVGTADPAAHPAVDAGPRRTISAVARRGGA